MVGLMLKVRIQARKIVLYYLPLTFTFLTAYCLCLAFNPLAYPSNAHALAGTIYYVSKNGNNANGLSWASAWNELDQINWSVVRPGDTIQLDGGSQRMTYTTTLAIGKSGTQTAPITIERATDAGHNGKVVLFGGRSTPLPYCGQLNYVYQASGVLNHGIVMNANSWVIIDGGSWDGMSIYGFNSHGVDMTSNPANDTLRNIEIYDNGSASQSGGRWRPETNGHGVYLNGSNLTFEKMDIHDNSDDEFDTGIGSINNITIRYSWLHITREDPTVSGLPFNQCVHQDGYQIYSGGTQGRILFESDIVGPGLSEGTILGNTPNSVNSGATVNNVTIRNSLFLNKVINIMGYPQVQESGWVLDHDTVFTPGIGLTASNGVPGGSALFLQGSNNTVTNSIFYGGLVYLPDGLVGAANNCQWKMTGGAPAISGQTVDPKFVTDVSSFNVSTPLAAIADADFALQPASPCKGLGSSITSLNRLLQIVRAPAPTPTPQLTPVSTQNPIVIATSVPAGPGKAQGPTNPASPPDNFATIKWIVVGALVFVGVITLAIVLYRKSRNTG